MSPPTAATDDHYAPVPRPRRTFTWWDFGTLWVGLVVGIPSYYVAGNLVELGMTWWQGILTVVLATAIVLLPIVLTSVPGARHGISFPVLARASFGVRGAKLPTLLRGLVACGWCGINSWIGGQAILLLVPTTSPSSTPCPWTRCPIPWLGISPLDSAGFAACLVVQITLFWRGMEGIRKLGRYSAPVLVALTAALFLWGLAKAGGLGGMLSPVPSPPASKFWALFFPALAANVGSWSTLAVNIPDFTRYARSQADQVAGQAGLPVLTGAFAFVGLAVTSASETIFGAPIPDPVRLVRKIVETNGGISGAITALVSVVGIALAVITTNVLANVVASANALINLKPSLFGFRSAALASMVAGAVVFQPWRLYDSSESFLKAWLLGYSTVTGPISGIMLADYYVVRRMVLDVEELYSSSPGGAHYYWKGYNPNAVAALVVPFAAMVPGFLHEVGVLRDVHWLLDWIYNVSWFFGFFSAGVVYWVLSSCSCCRWRGGREINERLLP